MTKDEFIDGYCERSKMSREDVLDGFVALPCYCGEEICSGWALVSEKLTEWHMKTDGRPPDQTTESK